MAQSVCSNVKKMFRNGLKSIVVGAERRWVLRRSMSYTADVGRTPVFVPSPNLPSTIPPLSERMSEKHKDKEWSKEQVEDALQKHTIFAWGASDATREGNVIAVRGDGVYMYDIDGNKYMDMSSGAVCTNLGNTVPAEVKEAVNKSMDKMGFAFGCLYSTESRARLSSLLADVVPGDINSFMFTSSGSEANECAMRMARRYTGRFKVFSRARSYHGGTATSLAATGDPRSWAVDNQSVGMVKMIDPYPFTFEWGPTEVDRVEKSLGVLHEQILTEGPKNIACILLESFTGSNGWLNPPQQYMQGVRALCDKYGIIMIMDEVMTGFGRTGKFFGFEHFDGVLPDIITFAKGSTSAYAPLGCIGLREPIMDFFRKNPSGYGSTYTAHPLITAVGEAVIKYTIENDVLGNVERVAPLYASLLQDLAFKHPCVKAARSIGLAGGFDLAGKDGNFLMDMHQTHPAIPFLKARLKDLGLITLIRGHFLHLTPPLIISEAEIKKAFAILDVALTDLDEFLAKQ